MPTRLASLGVLVLLATGCPGGSFGTTEGTIGPPGRSFSTTGGSSGSAGGNSLDGPLAFTPRSAVDREDGGFQVVISDDAFSCGFSSTAQKVTLAVALRDGGLPTLGSYLLDGGGVSLLRVDAQDAVVAVAVAGTVTLNRLDDAVLGGNFIGEFRAPDGGLPASVLSGIFGATRCH